MPIVDMPLAELKKYKGINPRPKDFDRFWEDALAEMRSVDPKVTLEPAEFQAPFAECFDLTFTGVRGARMYAKYLRRARRRRRIRRCSCSTATPGTARTGRRNWATSRRVSPWRRWIAAARAADPKTSA